MASRLSALVINLDRDVDRLERITRDLSDEPDVHMVRIAGIAGASIPFVARSALAYNEGWASKPGEIGCFLSHVRAWEYAASQDVRFSIILEDDAIPCGFARLAGAELPGDFEFIFINDRMTVGTRSDAATLPLTFVPVGQSLPLLNERPNGVGGDGYIVTREGARKLLAAVAQDFFFGHVDWRMLRYCVTPEELDGPLTDTFVASVIRNHHNPYRPPAWGVLRAYCANTPLVHSGFVSSTRELMNKMTSGEHETGIVP